MCYYFKDRGPLIMMVEMPKEDEKIDVDDYDDADDDNDYIDTACCYKGAG